MAAWTPCVGCSCPNHNVPGQIPLRGLESLLTESPSLKLLSQTNNVPLPGEVNVVHAVIAEASQFISQLRREQSVIRQGQKVIKEQLARFYELLKLQDDVCQQVETFIAEKRSILSCVRRVPMEILHEVFLASVEFTPHQAWRPSEDLNNWVLQHPMTPLDSIGLVSKGWRAAVLSCDKIWSYIHIEDTNLCTEESPSVRRLVRHIERSTSYPLTVSIYQPFSFDIVSLLASFSNRIKDLYLFVSMDVLKNLNVLQSSLQSLHSCIMIFSDGTEPPIYGEEIQYKIEFCRDAPNLQKVDLWEVGPLPYSGHIVLPWNHIKIFKCTGLTSWVNTHEILRILQEAQDLEECILHCQVLDDTIINFDYRVVACPKLRSFRLIGDNRRWSTGVRTLLDNMEAPALTHLDIAFEDVLANGDNTHLMPLILKFVERSRCKLTYLRIANMMVSREDTSYILQAFHSLEELHLSNVGPDALTNVHLHQLAFDSQDGVVPCALPMLHTLHLEGEWSFSPTNFVEMAAWRRTHHYVPLRRLDLFVKEDEDVDITLRHEKLLHSICSALSVYERGGLSFNVAHVSSEQYEDTLMRMHRAPGRPESP
ncbi:hypothetical protein ARMSODRAFT_954333 [Armillaria solidipes]|uniref:F-box domain-containing protein n=1 Tax=Armillaria solidipes TaxID=1076256 RepID=A0A2H3BZQ4_9AGAR|nr:hypothetical protein ARMSODRAFT_954333 [Armillaria solidipes]